MKAKALIYVTAEKTRALHPSCSFAKTTMAINKCLNVELSLTEANYRALIAVLNSVSRAEPVDGAVKGLPSAAKSLHAGEVAWRAYRMEFCQARGDMDQGGSGTPSDALQCRIALTRHHIEELWEIYGEAF